MSTYVVGSDNINGKEQSYIQACIKKLENKGHICENAGVGPNIVQSKGLSSSSTGKIGVIIVGGSDAGMYYDFVTGLKNGYYHYKYMWVVFASNTATTDKWITCNGLANTKLVRAHDDNYSGSGISNVVGKTAKQYFTENKQYIGFVCGKKGCSFDEIASKLANGGDSEEETESSTNTIKDSICEVLSVLDGEIECTVENNIIHIHKVPNPEEKHLPIEIIEGENIKLNSITVKDYHPDTTNKLIVKWSGEDITLTNEELINRFGEKSLELDAVKLTPKKEESANVSTESTTEETTTNTSNTEYEEVPVETYEEALHFANVEWAKIRRENGHEIELAVIGNFNYKSGWIHVRLYSYPFSGWMYIKTTDHNITSNGEYLTNLTLVDYPPSIGKYDESNTDSEETEELLEEDVTT